MTKNFTQNPAATTLTGTEVVPAIQAGVDVRTTVAALIAMAQARAGHTGFQAQSTITGLVADLAAKAADSAVVKLTGNQTVAGVKTFSSAPVVPDGSWTISDTAGLQDALDALPVDGAVVHDTGNETVAGIKTFTSPPVVPDGSWAIADTSGLQPALDAKAADSAVVKLSGNQTVAGTKTFSSPPVVPEPTAAGHAASRGYVIRSVGVDVGVPGGVDDTALFNTARTAAGVGGTVIFSGGTYVLSGATASVADQHIVVRPGATLKTKDVADTPTLNVTADGVRIDGGGTIDGNKGNQTLVEIGDSTGGPTAGVRIVGADRCTVADLSIINCGNHAVYVSDSTGDRILRNRIANCGPDGNFKTVFLYDYYGAVTDVEIAGNTIDGTASTKNGCIAVAMYSTVCSDVRIHHNRLLVGNGEATPTLGIELFTSELSPGVGGSIQDVVIDHNVIQGEAGAAFGDQLYGISVGGVSPTEDEGDTNIVVSGNIIRNCPSHSIEVIGSSVAVTGNTITDSGQIAVYAVEVEGGIHGVTITGNTLINSANASYAFVLSGSTNGIFGLVIANNTIVNPAGTCVSTAGTIAGLTIQGNTLREAVSHAVLIDGTVTDSTISGNTFDLSDSVASDIHGVYLASATSARIKIEGNTILGATGTGVCGWAAMTDIDVLNNTVSGCDNGIRAFSAATRWHIVGNRVHDNTTGGVVMHASSTNLSIASNAVYGNGTNYVTTGATFITHVINGAGG